MASTLPSHRTRSWSSAHRKMHAAGTLQTSTMAIPRCRGLCRYQEPNRDPAPQQSPSGTAVRPAPGPAPSMPISEAVERVVVSPVFRTAPWDPVLLQQQEQNPQACILIVSESDVCRSVLAEACVREQLEAAGLTGQVQLATCGTRSYNLGEGPEPTAVAAAEALGITLPTDHRARQFDPGADIVAYDLLLVMDKYTAGDVMREVSSFDLVNRQAQFSCKVRRLGEFLHGNNLPSSGAQGAAEKYGSSGDEGEMDIDDPLYGNIGGEEEQSAVLSTARLVQVAARGLVRFLRDIQAEAQNAQEAAAPASAAATPSPDDAHDDDATDADVSCELPLPGQAPVCTSTASTTTTSSDESDSDTQRSEPQSSPSSAPLPSPLPSAPPALGPLLRSRVATMGPAKWLAPPMLSRRVDVDRTR